MNIESQKLVDAEGLLKVLFDEESRPSVRWLWEMKKRRAIPFIQIGRLIRGRLAFEEACH